MLASVLQERLNALVEGAAKGKGSIAGMRFAAVYEVIEGGSGAFGEDLHCTVVDHEEVVPWLREGGQQRPERALGGWRSGRRQIYA